jgi:hypothetical protein
MHQLCCRLDIHTVFWWGNLKEGENLENLGVSGIIKKGVSRGFGMDWVDLAEGQE